MAFEISYSMYFLRPQVVRKGTGSFGASVVVVGIVCGPVGVGFGPKGLRGGPQADGWVQVRVLDRAGCGINDGFGRGVVVGGGGPPGRGDVACVADGSGPQG